MARGEEGGGHTYPGDKAVAHILGHDLVLLQLLQEDVPDNTAQKLVGKHRSMELGSDEGILNSKSAGTVFTIN